MFHPRIPTGWTPENDVRRAQERQIERSPGGGYGYIYGACGSVVGVCKPCLGYRDETEHHPRCPRRR